MDILELTRQALTLALVASAPVLITSMVVGLVVAIFQAATQIQEQTLTFVPKLLAIIVCLLLAGGWIGALLLRFTRQVLLAIGRI